MNFGELKHEVCFNTYDHKKFEGAAGRYLNQAAREVGRVTNYNWMSTELEVQDAGDGRAAAAVTSPLESHPTWSAFLRFSLRSPSGGMSELTIEPGVGQHHQFPVQAPDGGRIAARLVRGMGGDTYRLLFEQAPPPGSRVRVEGLLAPGLMVEDSDESELGPDADYALVAFARARLAIREDDVDTRTAWAQEYQAELMRLQMGRQLGGTQVVPGGNVSQTFWG